MQLSDDELFSSDLGPDRSRGIALSGPRACVQLLAKLYKVRYLQEVTCIIMIIVNKFMVTAD